MPRTAVTYEQVRSIADALYATGIKNPGATAIRAELAKRADGSPVGSPNTIQSHLLVWRQRDRPERSGVPLPGDADTIKSGFGSETVFYIAGRLQEAAAVLPRPLLESMTPPTGDMRKVAEYLLALDELMAHYRERPVR